MQMISVLRQEPRNSRIINPVRPAAMAASFTTPDHRRPHEDGLVEQRRDLQFLDYRGTRGKIVGNASFTRLTMSSVEALPSL